MNLNDYSLWTALVTPLTPGLQVDYPSLERLIKEQEKADNGLLILGSTGEALNLDLNTKKSIVEFVLNLKPKSPVMIGVGGHQLTSQLEWIKWLETKDIDAYLMVTPIYAKPGDEGQYDWFKALMDAVSKPVMLYNVPGRAGKELSFKAVEKLRNHKNFWSIKEASGSVAKMKQYLKASGQGKVYCGDDGLMPEFAEAGSCGLVSVAANAWPQETNLYVKQSLSKNIEAKELWQNAADSLFIASNPIPVKAIIADENRILHDTMMPPLSRAELKDLAVLRNSSKNVREWFKNNK